jgi:hypothetical protein
MNDQEKIITVQELAIFTYCPRSWLLNKLNDRTDPDIQRLISIITPSSPSTNIPVFIEDMGRAAEERGMGCPLFGSTIIFIILFLSIVTTRIIFH